MEHTHIHNTKKKLAIVFAIIVFSIALLLEVIFFSFRYINTSFNDEKQFDEITSQISKQIQINPDFLTLFIKEGIKFKPPKDDGFRRGGMGPERGLKFLNFLILDADGNILAQNYNQDIEFDINDIKNIPNNTVQDKNGIISKKIDIEGIGNNFKELIFFKREGYSIDDYFEDIFFFLMINIIFSFFFYFIGLYFVGKNLYPVEQSLTDMNDFIHNSNHELKTPIAVISSNLQLLKSLKTYEEDLIDDSIKEIKRIDELLFGLSQLSNINSVQENADLNIVEIIQEIKEELKHEITGKKLNVIIKTLKIPHIKANKHYLYILLSNLFRNAIKYNHEEGIIEIYIDKNSFNIRNSGPGIHTQDIPFIFNRFFKGEKGRNTEGFGIGLSLVKKICDIYGWKTEVTSGENSFTQFTIHF